MLFAIIYLFANKLQSRTLFHRNFMRAFFWLLWNLWDCRNSKMSLFLIRPYRSENSLEISVCVSPINVNLSRLLLFLQVSLQVCDINSYQLLTHQAPTNVHNCDCVSVHWINWSSIPTSSSFDPPGHCRTGGHYFHMCPSVNTYIWKTKTCYTWGLMGH